MPEWTPDSRLELAVNYKDESGEMVHRVLTGKDHWLNFFAENQDWGFLALDMFQNADMAFRQKFSEWVDHAQDSIDRAYAAAIAQYDPVSNYDRKEEHETEGSHDVNRTAGRAKKNTSESYADSGAESYNGKKLSFAKNARSGEMDVNADLTGDYTNGEQRSTPETSATLDTTMKESGFTVSSIDITDGEAVVTQVQTASYNGAEKDVNKTTQKGSTASRSVSAAAGSQQETETETGNEQGTNKGTEKIRAYGNIGVTTSQQMVTEEISLRFSLNFIEMCFEWFKRDCLFYGGWD